MVFKDLTDKNGDVSWDVNLLIIDVENRIWTPYENDLQMVGHPWSNHP